MPKPYPKQGMPPKKAKKPLKRTAIKKKYVNGQTNKINRQEVLQETKKILYGKANKGNSKVLQKLGQETRDAKIPANKRPNGLLKITPIKKKFKKTGELSVFKEIWSERPHVCQVTDKPIYQFDIRCFSHILSKGSYPSYRKDKRNIWLVLPEIHDRWEFKDRSNPIFDKKREVLEMLKQEYYSNNR